MTEIIQYIRYVLSQRKEFRDVEVIERDKSLLFVYADRFYRTNEPCMSCMFAEFHFESAKQLLGQADKIMQLAYEDLLELQDCLGVSQWNHVRTRNWIL